MRIVLASLLIGGCAASAPPAPQVITPDMVRTMSAVDLCIGLGFWGPISSGNAASELHRRGLDCKDYAAQIQARMQADAQAEQQRRAIAASILMQNMQRPTGQVSVFQMPQPITCTTQRFGSTYQSVCR
jgi:hypothetical protein